MKAVDNFDVTNSYCVVMPLYEGGDLSQYFHDDKIFELWRKDKILKIFLQIVIAIEYLHSKEIIYRDAKPQNCLLDNDLNVVICDFGISCEGDSNL